MIKPGSTQTEKHHVRKTMKALGIIILSGLLILMIASVLYIYRTCCMTMLDTAIGLTVLLLAEITSFILIMKMMHNKGKRKWYTVITTVIFLFFCAVTSKYILFPPVREIPTTGSYQVASEDYWVNLDTYLTDGSCGSCKSENGFLLMYTDIYSISDICRRSQSMMISSHSAMSWNYLKMAVNHYILRMENDMSDRPELCKDMDSTVFRDYYYLKEEMVAFCRENGLPVSGGKLELTERIAHFLDTGEVLPTQPRLTRAKTDTHLEITLSAVIEENYVCSEKHRAFFKSEIGSSFSFNVEFQKWLKNNAGKTYADAIAAYHQIMEQKKTAKTTIGKQFEYNTYIRAFFEDNPGKTIADAIKCWKYKKSRKGHNQYERADLIALEK